MTLSVPQFVAQCRANSCCLLGASRVSRSVVLIALSVELGLVSLLLGKKASSSRLLPVVWWSRL